MAIFGFGKIKFGFGDQVWQWPYSGLVRSSLAVVIFDKFVWQLFLVILLQLQISASLWVFWYGISSKFLCLGCSLRC